MKEDNNPFRPTLSKPVDDSVLATDPHADNFLAGNDRLAQQQRVTMDMVNNSADTTPHLDQMGVSNNATNQPIDLTSALNEAPQGDFGSVMPSASGNAATQPSTSIFDGIAGDKKDKKKSKKSLLGRKKKAASVKTSEGKSAPISPAAATESVFGSSLDFGKVSDSHDTQSTVNGDVNHDIASLGMNIDDVNASGHHAASTEQHDAVNMLDGLTASDSHHDEALSPIGASLAAAAEAADSKSGGVDIAPTKDAGKGKGTKNGQPKQLTVSVLTIIFFILFAGATATAVYFGIQNNKNANALGDAQAELQQLKDQNADSSNSANKESTQFDALQDRIKDLTEQNDAKQKTIDENKTTIDNLNKQVTDLNQQVTAANNKLTSDTTVSDKMQSLITTLCAAGEPYSNSSVCIDANGGNAGAVQPTPQQ